MSVQLVIAEKPSVARSIAAVIGAGEKQNGYWQGRFAACAFVECVCDAGRTRNSWGVAPNPTRDAVT